MARQFAKKKSIATGYTQILLLLERVTQRNVQGAMGSLKKMLIFVFPNQLVCEMFHIRKRGCLLSALFLDVALQCAYREQPDEKES